MYDPESKAFQVLAEEELVFIPLLKEFIRNENYSKIYITYIILRAKLNVLVSGRLLELRSFAQLRQALPHAQLCSANF